jgi:uncharacterized membrane protein (UPF0127 family)
MEIVFGRKKIRIGKVKKVGLLGKLRGLMFRTKNTKNLLFDFSREGRWGIHSCFVFFDFLAVWLTEDNKVVEVGRVKPFCLNVVPKNNFRKLLEIPFNNRNKKVIKKLVGEERFK